MVTKDALTEKLEEIQEYVDMDDFEGALTATSELRDLLEAAQKEGAQ